MKHPTYPQLKEHISAMPICPSVRELALAQVNLCEALGMTVKECIDRLEGLNEMQPESIPSIKKLTALAMQTVFEVAKLSNYKEVMIVEEHNDCRITPIANGCENLITIESFN